MRGLLRQAHRLVRRAERHPQPGPLGRDTPSMRRSAWKKSNDHGARASAANRARRAVATAIRGGHRLTSPRVSDTSTSSVNVFMDARRPKNLLQHRAEQERAAAGERRLVHGEPHLEAAREHDGPRHGQPAGPRARRPPGARPAPGAARAHPPRRRPPGRRRARAARAAPSRPASRSRSVTAR